MVCDEMKDLIDELIDGELDAERAAVVRSHIELCAGCRGLYERHLRAAELVRSLPVVKAPRDYSAAVREAIEGRRASAPRAIRAAGGMPVWLKPALAAAACLMLAAVIGVRVFHERERSLSTRDEDAARAGAPRPAAKAMPEGEPAPPVAVDGALRETTEEFSLKAGKLAPEPRAADPAGPPAEAPAAAILPADRTKAAHGWVGDAEADAAERPLPAEAEAAKEGLRRALAAKPELKAPSTALAEGAADRAPATREEAAAVHGAPGAPPAPRPSAPAEPALRRGLRSAGEEVEAKKAAAPDAAAAKRTIASEPLPRAAEKAKALDFGHASAKKQFVAGQAQRPEAEPEVMADQADSRDAGQLDKLAGVERKAASAAPPARARRTASIAKADEAAQAYRGQPKGGRGGGAALGGERLGRAAPGAVQEEAKQLRPVAGQANATQHLADKDSARLSWGARNALQAEVEIGRIARMFGGSVHWRARPGGAAVLVAEVPAGRSAAFATAIRQGPGRTGADEEEMEDAIPQAEQRAEPAEAEQLLAKRDKPGTTGRAADALQGATAPAGRPETGAGGRTGQRALSRVAPAPEQRPQQGPVYVSFEIDIVIQR